MVHERPQLIEGEIYYVEEESSIFPNGIVMFFSPLVKLCVDPHSGSFIGHLRNDAAFCTALDYLERVASIEMSHVEIALLALHLHERLIYAKTWRRSRGLLSGSQSKPLEELRKLRRLAQQRTWIEYFDAFRKSSFFVKDMLANVFGDVIYPTTAALSPAALIAAVDKALADPNMKRRPREFELDRCASTLIDIYERATGNLARLANDPETGKPNSSLHRFVLAYSKIYDVKLVTEASDGRLDKMLKNRSEFGNGDSFILGVPVTD